MAQPLNAVSFPLHGERLIEASAGTGKTYTIASLFLRLLLGHGKVDNKHPSPLTVDQILVVTFTEAATAELRDRIRRRIFEARLTFIREEADDPFGQALLDETPDWTQAIRTLRDAQRQMDEAAIYTIHGFCQRMLKQNAFESGSLFESEFITDESQIKSQAVADFWRSHFYGADKDLARVLVSCWQSPDALLGEIAAYLPKHELTLLTPIDEASLEQQHQDIIRAIGEFKGLWLSNEDDLQALISGSGVDKRSYSKKNLPNWLSQINQWANTSTRDYAIPDNLVRFRQDVLMEKTKKGEPPISGLFTACETLLDASLSIKEQVLARAINWIKERLSKTKSKSMELSFDDLLLNLSHALSGPAQEALASRIREAYPVAMIDEFQDTDPMQYRIFKTIYAQQPTTGLFMIGDPKQAIYGFRGADIFTYIKARRVVSAHYTLENNFRSSKQMINSVNTLFERADKPFIYHQDIQFEPVNFPSFKADSQLILEGQQAGAMQLWLDEPESGIINKNDYQNNMALATANEVNRLLTLSQQGLAFISQPGKESQALKAGSIAVLVRTGREAQKVRAALSAQQIKSVYLSNRDSVYSGQEALDIYRVLAACIEPTNDRLLRAVMATPLMDQAALELDQLFSDEKAWEALVVEFVDYAQLWQRRGVLPMLRRLLQQRQISQRLLALPGGERSLTDLLHLGELLQHASGELDGVHGLLRWLGQQLAQPNGNSEEQQLRLESDQNLVQIVTIHKSKGLEYDLVFLPFVCSFRAEKAALYHDEESQKTVLDLSKDPDSLVKADKERLAEDLRLLYVALTRSVYSCYLGLAPLRSGRGKSTNTDLFRSAIGYLLTGSEPSDLTALKLALSQLVEQSGAVLSSPPLHAPGIYQPMKEQVESVAPLTFNTSIEKDWWVTSYSALSRSHGPSHTYLPGFDAELIEEAKDSGVEEFNVFTFPKGAGPGTFLHELFEALDFPNAKGEELSKIVAEKLELGGFEPHWQRVLEDWVTDVLDAELIPELKLRNLTRQQIKVEMEFFLPMANISASRLTQLSRQFDHLSMSAPALSFSDVQGMLKGFIDLTFEFEGKYYVLDYKSNFLGSQLEDYGQANLAQAMTSHRYDLQYQLYSLALHRLLAQRIKGYDYDQHFGGVFYLFLRGMQPGGDGVFFNRPKREFIESLDKLFKGEAVTC